MLKLILLFSILMTNLSFSKTVKMYPTANTQIYEAQRLLEGKDHGEEAYELLRDILKNDTTINDVSRAKIQAAANEVENTLFWAKVKKLFNQFRYKERPYIKAWFLLSEAIMDSRIAINESSDSEILFIEDLLKNYFFPGHPEKVKIHYPSIMEFAFETWAFTRKNIKDTKVGASDEEEAIDKVSVDVKNYFGEEYELNEQTVIDFALAQIQLGIDILTLKEQYDYIEDRIKNRYLFESMFLQAITEPGSIMLDPQLAAFVKLVKVEIELGETSKMSDDFKDLLQSNFGEDILTQSKSTSSINLSKLYGLDHKGLKSNLELVEKKSKDNLSRNVLSLVSGIAGEDLTFLRGLQVVVVGLKEGEKIANNSKVIKTVHLLDKIFDKLASWSGKIKGNQRIGGNLKWISNKIRAGSANIVKLPSLAYDFTKYFKNSEYGRELIEAVKTNKHVQNGTLMKGLIALSILSDLTTATIEYRHLETQRERYDLIAETGARIGATTSYLLPVVGWIAAGVDFTDFMLGTGIDTADFFRFAGKTAGDITLSYYGFSETTLLLTDLEFSHKVPRHDVKLMLHGAHINDDTDLDQRSLSLFKEMESITINNMVLLYRAHRNLKRGANTDFGERIFTYKKQYESNKKVYKETLRKIEGYSL